MKTHCTNGHPYTPENTYITPYSYRCRTCDRDRRPVKAPRKSPEVARQEAESRLSPPKPTLTERQLKSMRDRVADGVPIRIVGKSFGVGRARVVSECADILKGRAA